MPTNVGFDNISLPFILTDEWGKVYATWNLYFGDLTFINHEEILSEGPDH